MQVKNVMTWKRVIEISTISGTNFLQEKKCTISGTRIVPEIVHPILLHDVQPLFKSCACVNAVALYHEVFVLFVLL